MSKARSYSQKIEQMRCTHPVHFCRGVLGSNSCIGRACSCLVVFHTHPRSVWSRALSFSDGFKAYRLRSRWGFRTVPCRLPTLDPTLPLSRLWAQLTLCRGACFSTKLSSFSASKCRFVSEHTVHVEEHRASTSVSSRRPYLFRYAAFGVL